MIIDKMCDTIEEWLDIELSEKDMFEILKMTITNIQQKYGHDDPYTIYLMKELQGELE